MTSPAHSIKTRILPFGEQAIEEGAEHVRAGQVVAVSTETVYGLAGDATSDHAVAAIYAAKGRPSFNPLIIHVSDLEMAARFAHFSDPAISLAQRFWPGPLTLVLTLREDAGLSPLVTAGLPSVAIRVPAHAAMRALINASGVPLAAPSANVSGSISPTSAAHVMRSLSGRIPLIIDGGETQQGLESTIIAPEKHGIRLLRPGPVSPEMIGLPVIENTSSAIEAPGQLLSHYAPSKPLRLNALFAHSDEYFIGFGEMACDDNLSISGDLIEAASHLFAALHRADAAHHRRIAIAPIATQGIGLAINDRLQRAAA
jgi:L-threonylcarbamoyladenylate synthase